MTIHKFQVDISDKVNNDESNETNVLSDTEQYCFHLIDYIEKVADLNDFVINIGSVSEITDYTEKRDDKVSGNYFTVEIRSHNLNNSCVLPVFDGTIFRDEYIYIGGDIAGGFVVEIKDQDGNVLQTFNTSGVYTVEVLQQILDTITANTATIIDPNSIMANVDIRVGKKDAAFFSANPTLILKDGQFLFNSDTLELFIGDGTSQLSALVAINVPPSSGVQSVTGLQVDDTDPANPVVNTPTLQQVITESPTVNGVVMQSLDGNTTVTINDDLVSVSSINGSNTSQVDISSSSISVLSGDGTNASSTTINPTLIDFSANSVTKNSSEIAQLASPTFTGTITTPAIIVSSETASRVAIIDASKNVKSADTATYPSLAELAYVKGVTSAIQTQLDAKLAKASNLSDLANSLTARVNLGIIDIHITTGDQTTTSNAASNITDLVSPTLTINSRYKINGLIRVGCNATGGVKLQITIPTGATMSVISDGNTSGTGGRSFNNITTSATLFTTPVGTVNSVNSYAQISGEISIGATSGTIQFGFASTTNTQLSSIYQLGTNITLIKIT
jgi:hypothetical protein